MQNLHSFDARAMRASSGDSRNELPPQVSSSVLPSKRHRHLLHKMENEESQSKFQKNVTGHLLTNNQNSNNINVLASQPKNQQFKS